LGKPAMAAARGSGPSMSQSANTWRRPDSAITLGLPKDKYFNATQSSLGLQLKSNRESSFAYSMGKYNAYRSPTGLPAHQHPADRVFLGEAHQRHLIPSTPGPGSYNRLTSTGVQPLSRRRTAASFSFGTTPRFGYVDRTIAKNATPGPGAYVN